MSVCSVRAMRALLRILLLCVAIPRNLGSDDGRPLVNTKYGKLRGKTVTVKEAEGTVDAFYGIPFAKPPVGPLRFTAPEAPEPWETVREATDLPPMCLQPMEATRRMAELWRLKVTYPRVSEDCLYLNVFTPSDRSNDTKLPVMTFIHGGGLVMGAASEYDGSALSAIEKVLTVSVQYRLGILGFLSYGNSERSSGNYGLMDQVTALKWVQENIEDFGGDPKSVTVFGESAGGTSVSTLLLSPLSKDLFHRAIAQSGVALMPGVATHSQEELIHYRDSVANESGCEPSSVVDCLMKKSEQELSSIISTMKFLPVPIIADGVFLPKQPKEIIAAKENIKVPFMIGVNEQEFGWLLPKSLDVAYMDGLPKESIQQEMGRSLFLGEASKVDYTLLDEYFGNTDDSVKNRDNFIDLQGDYMFVIPALTIAKHHRDSGASVYFYEFQRRPSLYGDSRPQWVKVDHGDELVFVLGAPFLRDGAMFESHNYPEEEKQLSKTIMRYWANFARTGNPNGPSLTAWPQYEQDEAYLQINVQQKAANRLKHQKYHFWTTGLHEKIRNISAQRGASDRL